MSRCIQNIRTSSFQSSKVLVLNWCSSMKTSIAVFTLNRERGKSHFIWNLNILISLQSRLITFLLQSPLHIHRIWIFSSTDNFHQHLDILPLGMKTLFSSWLLIHYRFFSPSFKYCISRHLLVFIYLPPPNHFPFLVEIDPHFSSGLLLLPILWC